MRTNSSIQPITSDDTNSIVQKLRSGEVIACAAEGVWGLCCDPFNQHAVNQLLKLKQRSMHKGLIIVVGDLQQFIAISGKLRQQQMDWVQQCMSEPVLTTWLVTHRQTVHRQTIPSWITGSHTEVAVRITKQPALVKLTQTMGSALVSTSANPSGEAPALTAEQVKQYFPNLPIMPSAVMAQYQHQVSQIRSLTSGELIVSR